MADDEDRVKERGPSEWQDFWDREITDSEKRRSKFIDRGDKSVKRFVDDRDYTGDFGVRSNNANWRNFKLNFFHYILLHRYSIGRLTALICNNYPCVFIIANPVNSKPLFITGRTTPNNIHGLCN